MRPSLALVIVMAVFGLAHADPAKLVKQYSGRIIISPDPAPSVGSDLPDYVKANAVAGDGYELVKGPPWEVHLIGFLAKEPGAATVQLVFGDATNAKAEPVAVVDVAAKNRIVIATLRATTAAGFEPNKPYVLRLMQGKTVLAKAQLTLRN
ncbi:MAG: hypothetical protein H6Q90_4287 [Deltaproteobacteria bacterium]|nr:hypothetical protein [Deltaproteobacteria bacterium]